jgi:hypothetical protein
MKPPEGHPPEGFRLLCGGLHQDALEFADNDIDRLAANCINFVPEKLRPELRLFLEDSLDRLTAAELKGVMNRAKADIGFRKRGAEAFLRATLKALS